ncbi:MAG: Spy/CpxP family protein refolding chaperone [Kiritimatiellaeota bacterium]|nr:Spy/CpxP family protein refolding chaperone [Kiritimatiellota bacterium]
MRKSMMMMLVAVAVVTMAQDNATTPRQRQAGAGAPGQPSAAAMNRGAGGMALQDGMLLALLETPRIADAIGLTDEQKEDLKAINEKFDGPMSELRQKQDATAQKQTAALRDAEATEEAILAAIDEAGAARTAFAKEQTRKMLAVRAKLTPEQLEKARQQMQQPTPNATRQPGANAQGVRPQPQGGAGTGGPAGIMNRPQPQGNRPQGGGQGQGTRQGAAGQGQGGGTRGTRPARQQ